jgi:hypothetical protein
VLAITAVSAVVGEIIDEADAIDVSSSVLVEEVVMSRAGLGNVL